MRRKRRSKDDDVPSLRDKFRAEVDDVTTAALDQLEAEHDRALEQAVGELLERLRAAIAPSAPVKKKPSARVKAQRDPTARQANGKRPPTCRKCGYVGGNTRGCGRSHPTQAKAAAATPAPPPQRATKTVPREKALREIRAAKVGKTDHKAAVAALARMRRGSDDDGDDEAEAAELRFE